MKKVDNPPAGGLGRYRGAGRYYKALNAAGISYEQLPLWQPFTLPSVKPIGRGAVVIFDVIPLKYPNHFPTGIKGKIKLFKNKLVLKKFNVILTISQVAKKDIQKYLKIPADRIHVACPPVDPVFLEAPKANNNTQILRSLAKAGLPQDDKYCIYVGDVNWNKNLPTLARSIKLSGISCVFVGKAFSTPPLLHKWHRGYQEFYDLAKNDTKFIFPGYVSDEELVELYRNAVCNVLVSHDEGFGYSYAEAGALATPSVLSDAPIFHETAGRTALFASPTDPQDIADKITSLLKDTKKRNELGTSAQKRALELFDPKDFTNAVLKLV